MEHLEEKMSGAQRLKVTVQAEEEKVLRMGEIPGREVF